MDRSNFASHAVYFGLTDAGTYVATSVTSPYFCFEAKTEKEVAALAKQALDFSYATTGVLGAPEFATAAAPESRITRVVRSRRSSIELAVA